MNDKLHYERELLSRGYKYIAGVDEVGRGPLAGPCGRRVRNNGPSKDSRRRG